MKRQKRDKQGRAFQRGYQAGLTGRSVEMCPHEQLEQRQHWINGWREGRADQWDGLSGLSSAHKAAFF